MSGTLVSSPGGDLPELDETSKKSVIIELD